MFKQVYSNVSSFEYLIEELSKLSEKIDWRVRLNEIKSKNINKLDGEDFDYRFIQMLTYSLRGNFKKYVIDKVIRDIFYVLFVNNIYYRFTGNIQILAFDDSDVISLSMKYGEGLITTIADYLFKTKFILQAMNLQYEVITKTTEILQGSNLIFFLSPFFKLPEDIPKCNSIIFPVPYTSAKEDYQVLPNIIILNLLNTCYADTFTDEENNKYEIKEYIIFRD